MQSPGAFCIVPPDTQKAAHTGRLSFCHEIRKTLENQGFRTCRFYFIKIYMEFDYYLSINVVF